jgi:hypothetical protein
MTTRGLDMEGLEAQAVQEASLFGDYLQRMLTALCQDERLCEGMLVGRGQRMRGCAAGCTAGSWRDA